MLKDKSIAVVVPSFNEETQIEHVIHSMPDFVDRIIIVNDCSKDKTSEKVIAAIENQQKSVHSFSDLTKIKITPTLYNRANIVVQEMAIQEKSYFTPHEIYNKDPHDRVILINHKKNGGVGAAIATGYKWCKDHDIDCTAVMAGDGQMDPYELRDICNPVIEEGVNYVKGNRLIHRSAPILIPKKRYFGNSILSILTKLASGYWRISDTQTGYTAISKSALNRINIYDIYKSYGMPNDLLVKLNIAMCTIKEVEIKPVYNVGEQSKMKIFKVIPTVSLLLIKSFFKRIWIKYLIRSFHPMFVLYHIGILLVILAIPFGYKLFDIFISGKDANPITVLGFIFLFFSGFQSFLFAMWMDIQDNERLYI